MMFILRPRLCPHKRKAEQEIINSLNNKCRLFQIEPNLLVWYACDEIATEGLINYAVSYNDINFNAEFKNMRRGRPLGSGKKTMTHIRIDTVVLDHYKATGAGWQTRVNNDLRRMAGV